MENKEELVFKIITLGDSGVGKTSIIRRYVYNDFDMNNMSTIGLNFAFKDVTLKNGVKIKLKIIDTAGQEKYRSLSRNYIKNAEGVLFVFSYENSSERKSFEHINQWVEFFNENNNIEKIQKYLVGNKNEFKDKSHIQQSEINELTKQIGGKFISVSAKINNNINMLFEDLSEMIYQNFEKKGKQKTKKIGKYNKEKKSMCNLCNEHDID